GQRGVGEDSLRNVGRDRSDGGARRRGPGRGGHARMYPGPGTGNQGPLIFASMPLVTRRSTVIATVGGVPVGSGHPIVVQSMTNTDTADVPATVSQVADLAVAGSELVRVTVNNEASAAALPAILEGLDRRGGTVPIIRDSHYNWHMLLPRST